MELPLYLSIILLLLLLYSSAWISSAETALFSLSSHKIKTFKRDPDSRKRLIADLLSHPRDLLVTVFMINTCVNIFLQNIASDMFGYNAGWELKVGVPLVITLVFGEIIPKYIGLQNNISISYRDAPMINWLQNCLHYARKWVIAITTPVSRLMFFFLKKEDNISKEEIEHVLKTSEQHGVLTKDEAELLSGYLNLQDQSVKELMWPKEDIVFYEISQPLTKLVHLFVDESTTRVPVCDKSLENILGVISATSYFKLQDQISTPKDLIPFLQKPFYIPETTPARKLLKKMNETHHVLAMVVDEYGSVTGLITREDLIEEVIGEVQEPGGPSPLFIKAGKNEVIASGKWDLSELNEYFDSNLESKSNMVSVGGWLIEQLGDIPKSGLKYESNGFLFHVLAASPNRITRLFIRKLPKRHT